MTNPKLIHLGALLFAALSLSSCGVAHVIPLSSQPSKLGQRAKETEPASPSSKPASIKNQAQKPDKRQASPSTKPRTARASSSENAPPLSTRTQHSSSVRYVPISGESSASQDPDEHRHEGDPGQEHAEATFHPQSSYTPQVLQNGLAVPYPLTNVFRGFGPCRRGHYIHPALDIGGVGPEWGIGSPVYSMAKSEILFIGTGAEDAGEFGIPDKRPGKVLRGRSMLPRQKDIPPYGTVHFFTRTKGRWRAGNVMVTRVLEGPFKGHTIRYMHLAAFHPKLSVGDILERSQELGLMGGTAVQESAPHVHIDISTPDGERLDVAPLLGLNPTKVPCPEPMNQSPRVFNEGHVPVSGCDPIIKEENFSSGLYSSHLYAIDLHNSVDTTVSVKVNSGHWHPKLSFQEKAAKVPLSGKKGKVARATFSPSQTTAHIKVESWDGQPPKDATYSLEITRACPDDSLKQKAESPSSKDSTASAKDSTASAKDNDSLPVYQARALSPLACGDNPISQDFASGKYGSHRYPIEGEGMFQVAVVNTNGNWRPRVHIEGNAEISMLGSSGKMGVRAESQIKAQTPFSVRVSSWDGMPPKDATYTLSVSRPCPKADDNPQEGLIYKNDPAELPACGSYSKDENFKSGKFERHHYQIQPEKAALIHIELRKTEGDWRPRIVLPDGQTRQLASGKIGAKALTTIKTSASFEFEITGWDGKPPKDASYYLSVVEKCPSKK